MTQGKIKTMGKTTKNYLRMFAFTGIVALGVNKVHAQQLLRENFGFKGTLSLSIGNLRNSFGICISTYYIKSFVQFNTSYSLSFSPNSLGSRNLLVQSRLAPGLSLFTSTNENKNVDLMWSELRQQGSGYYSLGYSYIFYKDNRNSSQRSGAFGLGLKNTFISFENDLFAGQGRDRFRTAHLDLSYQLGNQVFATGFSLWTGETRGAPWEETPSLDHPFGFRILEDLPYGKTSHGILYVGYGTELLYGNRTQYRLGVDSERIRNLIQNKVSHDLPFLPGKVERKTPHYPMLDENGCAVWGEIKERKTTPFISMGINENWSY